MRVKPDEDGHPQQVSIRSEWLRVESIVDLWRIEDEWWRERPVSRSYYDVRLEDGHRLSIFQDDLTEEWYQQPYG